MSADRVQRAEGRRGQYGGGAGGDWRQALAHLSRKMANMGVEPVCSPSCAMAAGPPKRREQRVGAGSAAAALQQLLRVSCQMAKLWIALIVCAKPRSSPAGLKCRPTRQAALRELRSCHAAWDVCCKACKLPLGLLAHSTSCMSVLL